MVSKEIERHLGGGDRQRNTRSAALVLNQLTLTFSGATSLCMGVKRDSSCPARTPERPTDGWPADHAPASVPSRGAAWPQRPALAAAAHSLPPIEPQRCAAIQAVFEGRRIDTHRVVGNPIDAAGRATAKAAALLLYTV